MTNKDKKLTAKQYKEIFDREINSNRIITTSDKTEELVITDGERWKQCYKKGNKTREKFPKYWFISDKCNLISVQRGKPFLVRKNKQGKDRFAYKFYIYEKDKDKPVLKSIQCHNLVWLVFDGKSYGSAKKMIKKDGIYAYSINGVNGHHVGDKSNNNPECIEALMGKVHRLVTRAQRLNRNNVEDVDNFLIDFELISNEEEPNKISVLFPGHKVDKNTLEMINDDEIKYIDTIDSLDNVKFTKQALNKMKSVSIIICAIDLLMDKYGVDFFEESKYLFTRDEEYLFYKCEQVENELSITEINQLSGLANKDYILCCLNEDNKVECYIDNIENIKKDEEKHMKYNFEVKDRKIVVNNFYIGKEPLNEYFKYHKLKNDNFSMDEVEELIDSVAYVLDEDEEYIQASDYLRIENMLEE